MPQGVYSDRQAAIVNRIHAALLTDVDEATLEQLEGVACPIPIPAQPGTSPVPESPLPRRE